MEEGGGDVGLAQLGLAMQQYAGPVHGVRERERRCSNAAQSSPARLPHHHISAAVLLVVVVGRRVSAVRLRIVASVIVVLFLVVGGVLAVGEGAEDLAGQIAQRREVFLQQRLERGRERSGVGRCRSVRCREVGNNLDVSGHRNNRLKHR